MKRYVKSDSAQNTSQLSFDFQYDENYNEQEIQSLIYDVLEHTMNLEILGIDFHPVDYGDIREFDGQDISQCTVDFSWINDYPGESIVNSIDEGLTSLGYTLIGYDFYSL